MFAIKTVQTKSLWVRIGTAILKLVIMTALALGISTLLFLPLQGIFSLSNQLEGFENAWMLSWFWTIPLVASIMTVFILRKWIDRMPISSAGWDFRDWHRELPEGMLWGVILISVGFILLLLGQQIGILNIQWDTNQILSWCFLFLVAAWFEEVLFRGYIQTMLSEHLGAKAGLYISAILFGLVHIPNENFTIVGGLNIILAGLLLGVVYLRTRRLWAVTGLHFAWNYFQGVVYGFGVSGIATYKVIDIELLGHPLLTGGEFGFEGSVLSVLILAAFIWWQRKWLQEPGSFQVEQDEIVQEEENLKHEMES
ncbi:MAG: CPBP family intramembrane metalloprotease [Saprospiraceae bacterium]|nr:CPBP family intramembrane metalloprotease [Saprospiraceae bacterium]